MTENTYGKAEVRLVRVVRDGPRHELRDLTVDVRLRGDFAHVYEDGSNEGTPATDTMKNTVFALAREHLSRGSVEDFGRVLADHLVASGERVHGTTVTLTEHPWTRLPGAGTAGDGLHDHAFRRDASGDHVAWVAVDGDVATVAAGIQDLFVLRTTGSGFVGFQRDALTTLPETDDRILATVVDARWTYAPDAVAAGIDYGAAWTSIHATLVERFADHFSPSVQTTLHRIAVGILEAHPEVVDVTIELPNRHHLLVDLAPFGLENPGEVFVATQDPFGVISATVART
ncbi:factor-independent urate hydroxylase [Patulibacter sp. NPDC049589]|uniref:factor-independent urate hydroxylase n=1 Tax=Patulibacter sp. NPDC049589 TaxID=3154731 RepID=UPI003415DCE5